MKQLLSLISTFMDIWELHLMDMPLFEEDFGYECLILLGSNYLIPTPPTEMTVNDEVWKKM